MTKDEEWMILKQKLLRKIDTENTEYREEIEYQALKNMTD